MLTQTTPRALVRALTFDILANAAANRQGIGAGGGERAPASLAARVVDLVEINETRAGRDGAPVKDQITEPGARTALRRDPPCLAGLPRDDPGRRALTVYAVACERLGACGGAALSIEATTPRGTAASVPDGGASTRVAIADTIRRAHSVADGCGVAGVVLAPRRGKARPITARALLDAVAIEGRDMSAILRAFGWSDHSAHRRKLALAFEDMREKLADELIAPRARPRA